jgi:ribonuclease D
MLIETERDLITLSEGLRTAPYICIDTEFVGERRYYPEVGTIQIAAPSTKGEQTVLAWISTDHS